MAESAPPLSPDVRLLRSITLRNILSFGPDTPPLELRALNVLIGPNGSGKSNLLACLSLLPAIIIDWNTPLRMGGSTAKDWFPQDGIPLPAVIATAVKLGSNYPVVVHELHFEEVQYQLHVRCEVVTSYPSGDVNDTDGVHVPYWAEFNSLNSTIKFDDQEKTGFTASAYSSILTQLRDKNTYPDLDDLFSAYTNVFSFQNWSFGNISLIRQPQRDNPSGNFLREGGDNLANVLYQFRRMPEAKKQVVNLLHELYEGIDDYETIVQADYIVLYLREGKKLIPASRLSDGTLRFLCLLAILCHPTPPPTHLH